MFTQQTQIRQRRRPALRPRDDVVSVTISRGPVAAGKHTALVTDVQRVANIRRHQALFAAHVEHAGGAAHNHGQDAGVTGELAELTRGQLGTVSQTRTVAIT